MTILGVVALCGVVYYVAGVGLGLRGLLRNRERIRDNVWVLLIPCGLLGVLIWATYDETVWVESRGSESPPSAKVRGH